MEQRKIAVISGGTAGIGRSIAEECIKQGIFVILLGRNEQGIHKLCTVWGKKWCDFYYLDLRETGKIEKVISEIIRKYKKIDVLVNCAGIAEFGSVLDMEISQVREAVNVNLLGTIFLTKEVAKNMVERKKGQIIIIDSIAGIKGFEYGSSYVVSKFGQVGFAQVLWEELKRYEIKVCSIRPGLVDTGFYEQMNENHDISLGLAVEDISYLAMSVINQSERSNISEIVVRPIKREAQHLFFDIINEKYGKNKNKSYSF